jgi:hypothetical protein
MTTSAKIIADSISPTGIRLTTMEVVLHRFVLAEFNTHRKLSRNSASSRAIPIEKQLARVLDEPAWPLAWPAEQPGMQGGDDLDGQNLVDAMELFRDVFKFTTGSIQNYLDDHPSKDSRLHKSLINRLLEPFMWHTIVVTSTEWMNFFHQRSSVYSPLAQPEIAVAADAMLACYQKSNPSPLNYGDWHLPYIQDGDREWAAQHADGNILLKRVSAARCARTSYLTQNGVRDQEEDLRLHDRLISAKPLHASPMEHQATPATPDDIFGNLVLGNLDGWHQYRHQIELEMQESSNTEVEYDGK